MQFIVGNRTNNLEMNFNKLKPNLNKLKTVKCPEFVLLYKTLLLKQPRKSTLEKLSRLLSRYNQNKIKIWATY